MISTRTNKDGTRSYDVRVGNGPSKAFPENDYRTRSEAKNAAKQHELDLKRGKRPGRLPTVGAYADRLMAHWAQETLRSGRKRKRSTLNTLEANLKALRRDFGSRSLSDLPRADARDKALAWPANSIKSACQLYNRAMDEYPEIQTNPFRGLAPTSRGRSDEAPPTPEEFASLLDACSVLGDEYAPVFRALLTFAAHSGMRPGELYALEWSDVDLDGGRIHVNRRLLAGTIDLPKSNKPRVIVLTAEARDALLSLERVCNYPFHNKSAGRLSASIVSGYWGRVTAKADLDYDFYLATRHAFAHYAYVKRGLSLNAIAQQMGWSASAASALLKVYGHGDSGWESEFEENVVELRAVGA